MLLALAAGRLPNIQPNYEYFNNILRMHEHITVKPKRNWMFVTHNKLNIHPDGSATFPDTGQELPAEEYPRLVDNLDRDKWSKEERCLILGALLHEFAKDIEQRESSSVRDVSHDWEQDFPELYQRLEKVVEAKAGCDYLHMHVTLEMKGEKGRGRFPDSSSLNSIMALEIEQKALEHHRWQVHTTMIIPAELTTDGEEDEIFEETKVCRHLGNSKVADDPNRASVHVSFPADAWAPLLSTCAEFPAHPVIKAGDRGYRQEKRQGEDCKDETLGLTQMELVPRIAMMQEVWSSPPNIAHSPSLYGIENATHSVEPEWERRAVILWTFETVHSIVTKKNKQELVTLPHGRTSWRFLTPLDPTSPVHQQQSVHEVKDARLLPFALPTAPALSLGSLGGGGPGSMASPVVETMRDSIVSPSPGFQQTLNAGMSENLNSTWDPASVVGSYGSYGMAAPHRPDGLSLVDTSGVYGTSHHGLATPPPSASLMSSYHTSFDGSYQNAYGHHGHYHHDVLSHEDGSLAGYMSSSAPGPVDAVDHVGHSSLAGSSLPNSTSRSLCSLAAVTDPFLTADGHAHGTCTTDAAPAASAHPDNPFAHVEPFEDTTAAGTGGHDSWADWPASATTTYATSSISSVMASNAAAVAQNGSHGDVLDWHSPAPGAGPVSASGGRTPAWAGGDEARDHWGSVTAGSTPALTPAAMRAGSGGAVAHGEVVGGDWVHVSQQAGEDEGQEFEMPEGRSDAPGLGLGHQRTASNSPIRQENDGSVQNTSGGGGGGLNRPLSVLDLASYTFSPIKRKRSRSDSLEDREDHPFDSNTKLARVYRDSKGSSFLGAAQDLD